VVGLPTAGAARGLDGGLVEPGDGGECRHQQKQFSAGHCLLQRAISFNKDDRNDVPPGVQRFMRRTSVDGSNAGLARRPDRLLGQEEAQSGPRGILGFCRFIFTRNRLMITHAPLRSGSFRSSGRPHAPYPSLGWPSGCI
jgi:hypothetical protein